MVFPRKMISTAMRRAEDSGVKSRFPESMNGLLQSLNSQRESKILCDIVLVVQSEEFAAHKGILAANSNYFMAMFTTNMIEKVQARVNLKDLAPSAVKSVLDFIYTGELEIHEGNVRNLLEASSFLLISVIKEACCQFLKSILEADNCLTIISIADEFYCEKLHQKALCFLYKEFLEVAKYEEFLNLNLEEVIELLSSDEIHVDNEYQLFEVLANWVTHDFAGRKQHLLQLLPVVRLHFVEPGLIENSSVYRKIMAEEFACRSVLSESIKNEVVACPRKSYSNVPVIMVVGGVNGSRILETVSCYIPSVKKWCELGEMNIPRWKLNVLTTEDSTVFAVGGLQEVSTIHQEVPYMEKYDAKTNQWTTFPMSNLPFPVDSTSFKAVGLGNEIIFIGGLGTVRDGPSVFSLRKERGEMKFKSLAPIPSRREAHTISAVSCHVYVIGGSTQAINLATPLGQNTVDRYDRKTDTWSSIAAMNQPRCHASSVTLQGKVFVVGGCHGARVFQSAEVYDPETSRWTVIAPMKTPQINAGIVAHSGKIWVMGGVDGPRGSILSSVECYDPAMDTWTTIFTMPEKRQDFKCCLAKVAYRTVASVMDEE